MMNIDVDLQRDIERIRQIPTIATLLDVICLTTGMGFAAVARVTQDRWIACQVRDDIGFGLASGGELKLETTICNEIRGDQQAVIIDHVQINESYCAHPTPLLYGFQSYISFPIVLTNGQFFGTLCAIDPKPALLDNPKVRGLFSAFTELISVHLQQTELLEQSQAVLTEQRLTRQRIEESENRYRNLSDSLEQQVQTRTQELQELVHDLKRSNENLEQFAYIASHDLQEPLRKIQAFGNLLQTDYAVQLGEGGINYLARMQSAARRMSVLVKDLLTFSRISTQQERVAPVSLNLLVQTILADLTVPIQETRAQIKVTDLPTVQGDQSQLGQLFQNLLSNALKFSFTGRPPQIRVSARLVGAEELPASVKPARLTIMYHCVEVADQGIGFNVKYVDRIFDVFQRLHGRNEFDGTGVGLAICKKVAANHGGAITAGSELGKGATFQVYLPVISG